eukprot:Phypoly_transcript_07785.p1 GENE.Phypoly_transcript_07785~~Phypoly_transcript_07785.p1  ORF type:complete len:432 (+),score=23.90 Phypoly_transcript_07785:112-1407(+)
MATEGVLKDRGNAAYADGNFAEALEYYTKAVEITQSREELSMLYSNRSATHYCLANYEAAAADGDKAIEYAPQWAKGYARKGSALILLGKYEEAHKAFSCGLVFDPKNAQMLKGIGECEIELAKIANTKRRIAQMSDDFDCVLCMKLLFAPVTTPCGHSFCRSCLVRALDHNSCCPLCRTVLHIGSQHPVNVTLQSIIERNFPDEYASRRYEMVNESEQDLDSMPLFLLGMVAFPNQPFPLHIFEPRYRLMLRRCLEGQRRFGIVCCTHAQPNGVDIGCMMEIKNSQTLPDGRSYVETVGTKRFRILSRWIQDGYMVGKVIAIKDESNEVEKIQARQCADQIRAHITHMMNTAATGGIGVHRGLKQLVESFREMPGLDDLESFSFWVASRLPLTVQISCDLLQVTSTLQRLQSLLQLVQGGNLQSPNCRIQ